MSKLTPADFAIFRTIWKLDNAAIDKLRSYNLTRINMPTFWDALDTQDHPWKDFIVVDKVDYEVVLYNCSWDMLEEYPKATSAKCTVGASLRQYHKSKGIALCRLFFTPVELKTGDYLFQPVDRLLLANARVSKKIEKELVA